MADKPDSTPFSEHETKIILAMMKNLTGPLQVDWEGVWKITGHANKGSVYRQWTNIRNKHGIKAGEGGPSAAGPSGAKGKKRSNDDGDGEANGADGPSPTKKSKGEGKAKPKVKAEQDGEECV